MRGLDLPLLALRTEEDGDREPRGWADSRSCERQGQGLVSRFSRKKCSPAGGWTLSQGDLCLTAAEVLR